MPTRIRRLRATLDGPARLPVGLAATAICLCVATLYASVFPPPVPRGAHALHAWVLRWAPPAVWVVLAGMCLSYGLRVDPVMRTRAAMVALGLFLLFLVALTFA